MGSFQFGAGFKEFKDAVERAGMQGLLDVCDSQLVFVLVEVEVIYHSFIYRKEFQINYMM